MNPGGLVLWCIFSRSQPSVLDLCKPVEVNIRCVLKFQSSQRLLEFTASYHKSSPLHVLSCFCGFSGLTQVRMLKLYVKHLALFSFVFTLTCFLQPSTSILSFFPGISQKSHCSLGSPLTTSCLRWQQAFSRPLVTMFYCIYRMEAGGLDLEKPFIYGELVL